MSGLGGKVGFFSPSPPIGLTAEVSQCLEGEHERVFQLFLIRHYLLGKLQRDDASRLRLHTLPPELEFGIDGSVKHEVLFQTLGVEGADRRVVAHLL